MSNPPYGSKKDSILGEIGLGIGKSRAWNLSTQDWCVNLLFGDNFYSDIKKYVGNLNVHLHMSKCSENTLKHLLTSMLNL